MILLLSRVYPHRTSWKNAVDRSGFEPATWLMWNCLGDLLMFLGEKVYTPSLSIPAFERHTLTSVIYSFFCWERASSWSIFSFSNVAFSLKRVPSIHVKSISQIIYYTKQAIGTLFVLSKVLSQHVERTTELQSS